MNITQACAVAGLGGKDNRPGDYEYYINEQIRANDPKAVGPFMMAVLERTRIGEKQQMILSNSNVTILKAYLLILI